MSESRERQGNYLAGRTMRALQITDWQRGHGMRPYV